MKIQKILVLFGIIFLLSACSTPSKYSNNFDKDIYSRLTDENIDSEFKNNDKDYHQYIDQSGNYSFYYPSDWILSIDNYGFQVVIQTKIDDGISEYVGISSQNLGKFLSVAEYYEELLYQLQMQHSQFQEIESKNINKGNLDGKIIIYQYEESGNKLLAQHLFGISSENIVYNISYHATQATFDKYLLGAHSIFNSFTPISN